MNIQDIFQRHHRLLLGSAALSLLLTGGSAQAAEVCDGTRFGAGPPTVLFAGNCVVTAADLASSPPTVQRLISGGPVGQLTIESDVSIINNSTVFQAGNTILSGAVAGDDIAVVTNAGVLRSISTSAAVVAANPSTIFRLINSGTIDSQGATTAVFVGQGVFGNALSDGDFRLDNTGSIFHSRPDNMLPHAIGIVSNSGDVTINNAGGVIEGPAAILGATNGAFFLTNENGGMISGSADFTATVFVGNQDASFIPNRVTVVNGVGSTISATGELASAITVGKIASGDDVANIFNHGTISSTGENGFAVVTGFMPAAVSAGGGVTLENDGIIDGDILLGNADDVVILAGGTISGSILAQTGNGSIDVTADSRINGAIASSSGAMFGDRSSVDLSLNFGDLTFTNDVALTVGHSPTNAVLNNNVFFSRLSTDLRTTQDGTGTVNFLFETDINQSVGTNSAGLKALNFLSGSSLLRTNGASYHVANTTIGSGAKLTLVPDLGGPVFTGFDGAKNGNRIAGDLTVNGTLDLGSGTLLLSPGPGGSAGSVSVAAGGTLATTITSDGPNDSRAGQTAATVTGSEQLGQIVNSGIVTIASGARVVPTIAAGVTVSDGARYNFITSGGEDGGPAASVGDGILVSSAGGVDFGLFRGDSILINGLAADVYLVANPGAAAADVLENLAVNVSAGGIVDRLVEFASPTGRAEGQTLFAELLSIPSSEEIAIALTQLAPDVSGGASQGAGAAQGGASNTVNARADGVQNALLTGETGVAAGEDLLAPIGLWGQAYGFNALQDERRSVQGFSAYGGGVAVGVDTEVADNLVAGAALSYGQTRVDGRGTLSSNRTDVDSYQATLYGVYQGDPWYVQSQFGYAFQQFDARRAVNVGAIRETPTADFDGDVFSLGASAGYPLKIGDVQFTPSVSLDYVQSRQDAYTETGAPTTALSVNENRDESLKTGVLARFSTSYEVDGGGKIAPEFRLGWFHELKADAPNSVSQFAFGSSSFTTRGASPARDSINLGAGVKFSDVDGFSGAVQYDSEFKDRYLSNTLTVRARWEF